MKPSKSMAGYLLIILSVSILASCKKDIMKYGSADSVYFTTDSTIYSFMDKETTITKDTMVVRIKLIGKLSDHAREVNVVLDSTDAIEGTDFSFIQPVMLMKDSNFVSCKVVLYRTADLKNTRKTIWFSIQNSAELNAAALATGEDVPSYYPKGFSSHRISFDDVFGKPAWWDSYFRLYQYSETKLNFYIEVMGSSKGPFTGPGGIGYSSSAVLYLLRVATAEYNKTHPDPLSDEYGPIIW